MTSELFDTHLTHKEAERWMQGYKRAWEERDVTQVLALFTPDVDYRECRFGPPLRGFASLEDYWRARVAEYQRDVHFRFQIWAVSGMEAYAGFQAEFTWLPINGIMELDAACRLRFHREPDGHILCTHFEEWLEQRGI